METETKQLEVEQPKTKRKVVKFSASDYNAVVNALRNLRNLNKGLIIESDLDQAQGTLVLLVFKEVLLDAFADFRPGKGKKIDRRLKVKITPMGDNSTDILSQIHDLALGDFSEVVRRARCISGQYLTILFSSMDAKEKFVHLMKTNFSTEVTLKC